MRRRLYARIPETGQGPFPDCVSSAGSDIEPVLIRLRGEFD
jgi:hypothetical protein